MVLLRRSVHLEPGESVVVHAAAGGVDMCRPAREGVGGRAGHRHREQREKRQLALDLGADVAIDANAENMTDALREANGGPRVDVVLDMTEGRITDESIAALAPFGRLAFYGMASRRPPAGGTGRAARPLDDDRRNVARTRRAGAGSARRCADRPLRSRRGRDTAAIPGGDYPLADARQAHEDLRARRTVGKLVLDPRR